ncbi:MAG TPA: phosphoadenylyl-sulfate reductase [Acidimicrobiia bacterium]|nr:phosphoadenylyl-sulfate reductase [Acidimicrobiia bacterium]
MSALPHSPLPQPVDARLGPNELAHLAVSLEQEPATETIAWAVERFGDGLVLAASFQDCVLIDLASQVAPDLDVVFLDTQYHFAETLWYVAQVRARYGLHLRIIEPDVPRDDRWLADPDACCRVRKIEPLARALEGKAAWMSGLRRSDGPTRASTPVVAHDATRGLVKVNPIAAWSDADVAAYAAERDLPVHPLADKGYASIGCWPCTRPVSADDDPRAGRWSDHAKLECGLHA